MSRSKWPNLARVAVLGVVLLATGCGEEAGDGKEISGSTNPVTTEGLPAPTYPDLPKRASYLKERLAELGALVKVEETPKVPELVPEEIEELVGELGKTDPIDRMNGADELLSHREIALPVLLDRVMDNNRYDFERSAMVDTIGRMGSRAAAGTLLKLVADDESPTVRSFAALALAEIGDDGVVPDLVLRFKYEEDGFVINALSTALHRLGIACGVEKLISYLDGRIRVRQEAAGTLHEMLGEDFKYDAWAAAGERTEAAKRMRRWWWQHGQELLLRLNSGREVGPGFEKRIIETIFELSQYQMRNVDDARFILEGLGPIAVPFLCRGVTDESQYVRAHSVEVFVRMGRSGESGSEVLRSSVGDPLIRADILRALGVARDQESYSLLLSAVGDPLIDVRICAVDSLGQLGNKDALSTLQALSSNPGDSDELRVALSFSLALLGDRSDLMTVVSLLDSKAPIDVWDLAERIDRLMRLGAGVKGEVDGSYPFDGPPAEKVKFFRADLGV